MASNDSTLSWIPDSLVSCGRTTINCTYSDGTVEADPDIAGIGVLISFLLTAIITFVAIIVGYFTCSIHPTLLNEYDDAVIQTVRHFLRKVFQRQSKKEPSLARREKRNKALTNFILVLSDQQLVTGLAILITGYYQRCTISGYHFVLVANLAWFSSTTHLSTLAVLHQYLVDNPVLKVWRLFGMICVLAMLLYAQLYVQWQTIYSLPMQCTFVMGFPNLAGAAEEGEIVLSNVVIWTGVILYLFFSYANNVVRLYAGPPASSIFTWIEISLRKTLGLEPQPSYITRAVNLSGQATRFRRMLLAHNLFWVTFTNSFLWQIVWMIFGNVFGIAQVVIARWEVDSDALSVSTYFVDGSESEVTFGQMVALLLLALPLLAAVEAYYDAKELNDDSDEYEEPGTSEAVMIAPESSEAEEGRTINGGWILLLALLITCLLGFLAFEAVYSWLYPSSIAVLAVGNLILVGFCLFAIQILWRICNIIMDFLNKRVVENLY